MRIKSIENGKEKSLIINAPEVRIVDVAEQFKSNDVEGALKELALGQGNIGGTALEDIEKFKQDKKEILNTIENVKEQSINLKTSNDETKIYTWNKSGIYLTAREGVVDLPNGWNQGRYEVVTFDVSNSEYSGQLIFGDPYNKKMAFRYGLNEKSQWQQLATIDDTDWIDLPLASGIQRYDGVAKYKRYNNVVEIRGRLSGIKTTNIILATLPIGFRPGYTIRNITFMQPNGTALVEVEKDGNIRFYNYTNMSLDVNSSLALSFSFLVD